MAVTLSLLAGAGWQFFDNNGNPLVGGLLYTYDAGTTTPRTTYTSSAGTTPNTNPIVLDSAGRVPEQVWLDIEYTYKFVLQDSNNVTIWTKDNISDVTNAADLLFTPAGANAVQRTVQDKERDIVSVKDFGATGDGLTDDTTSLQNALDAVRAVGGELFFPPGVYRTSAPLVLDYSSETLDPIEGAPNRTVLRGAGAGSVLIQSSHGGDLLRYLGGTGAGVHSFFAVVGIGFLGPDRLAGSRGLYLKDASYWRIERCNIDKFEYGFYGEDTLSSTFETCRLVGNTYGITFVRGGSGYQSYPNALSLNSCFISGSRRYGVFMNGGTTFQLRGGSVEGNGLDATNAADNAAIRNDCWGVRVENVGAEGRVGAVIDGVYFELNAGRSDLWLVQTPGSTVYNGLHVVSNSTFNRFSSSIYTLFNISYDNNAGGATSAVSVIGCGFGEITPSDTGGDPAYYSNSASRYYVASGVGKIQAYGNWFRTTSVNDKAVYAPLLPNYTWAGRPTPYGLAGNVFYAADMPLGSSGTSAALLVADGSRTRQTPLLLENNFNATPGTIGANSTYSINLPVTGAALGDYVTLSYDKALGDVILHGEVVSASATNLATYSQQLEQNTAWTKTAASITTDAATAPDGTLTADKLVENTATSGHSVKMTIPYASVPTSSVVTASIYAKKGERLAIRMIGYDGAAAAVATVDFDLVSFVATTVSGSPTLVTMTQEGNDWFRCSITYNVGTVTTTDLDAAVFLLDVTAGTPASYTGNGTSGAFLWGGQYQINGFVTPYILTTTTSASGTYYPITARFRNPTVAGIAVASGKVFASVSHPGPGTN